MYKNPSKRREEKYLVLRSLYWGPRYFKALLAATDLDRKQISKALRKLLANGDVNKKKIYKDNMSPVEISEFKIAMGVLRIEPKTKRQFTHLYEMSKNGKRKLAWWDYHK